MSTSGICVHLARPNLGLQGPIICWKRIAPGFKGCLTLELLNGGDAPLVVYPGVRIAQLVLSAVEGAPKVYSGRYKCPTGPEFTKIQDKEMRFFGGPQ